MRQTPARPPPTMTAEEIKTEVTEILKLAQLRRGQIKPRVLMARMQMLAAQLEDESAEVPADVFAALDNDGRRMCLTALLAIFAATLQEG